MGALEVSMCEEPARFEVQIDPVSGALFWSGAAAGDKDLTEMENGESLMLDPSHFRPGYLVIGFHPDVRCLVCGQIDIGQTGEYACAGCSFPLLWDDEEMTCQIAQNVMGEL